MSRGEKASFPEFFNANGKSIKDNQTFADEFNIYFSNIGKKLANDIQDNNVTFDQFLNTPIQTHFSFQPITNDIIEKIIDNLQSKSSHGHDGLSTKLLKSIKAEISTAITHIINQSLNTGTFPDNLKLAKVIPIHKKGDNKVFDNYLPISILPAISKVFEKVIFDQLYEHFNSNGLFYSSQYGFKKNNSI